MEIWLVGDSVIREAVEQFAADRGATLIDTSTPNATPEEVWCAQIHDVRLRENRSRTQLLAIVYLSQTPYDSENTVGQIKRRMPEDRKLFGLVYPDNSMVLEGFFHDNEPWVTVGIPASLSTEDVLAKLQELYSVSE